MPEWKYARLTGYYPRDARTQKQKAMEGKDEDENGLPLHYLEDYQESDPESFVGLAADRSYFGYNDKIVIREFPGVRFRIRDTGGNFNRVTGSGSFDIPVLRRKTAFGLTGHIHWMRENEAGQYQRKLALVTPSGLSLLSIASLILVLATRS